MKTKILKNDESVVTALKQNTECKIHDLPNIRFQCFKLFFPSQPSYIKINILPLLFPSPFLLLPPPFLHLPFSSFLILPPSLDIPTILLLFPPSSIFFYPSLLFLPNPYLLLKPLIVLDLMFQLNK